MRPPTVSITRNINIDRLKTSKAFKDVSQFKIDDLLEDEKESDGSFSDSDNDGENVEMVSEFCLDPTPPQKKITFKESCSEYICFAKTQSSDDFQDWLECLMQDDRLLKM